MNGDDIQLVTFRIGKHDFGFNVFQVERVLRYEEPTPLPKSPLFLEGTLVYGDDVVPVIDLRKRLEIAAPIEGETRVVVVESDGEKVALVVDAVLEVLKAPAARVAPPPSIVKGLAAEYVSELATRWVPRAPSRLTITPIAASRVISRTTGRSMKPPDLIRC